MSFAVHLAVSNRGGSTMIYRRGDNGQFVSMWTGPSTVEFYPFVITQPAGQLVLVADAPTVQSSSTIYPSSNIWQITMIGTSDFIPK